MESAVLPVLEVIIVTFSVFLVKRSQDKPKSRGRKWPASGRRNSNKFAVIFNLP